MVVQEIVDVCHPSDIAHTILLRTEGTNDICCTRSGDVPELAKHEASSRLTFHGLELLVADIHQCLTKLFLGHATGDKRMETEAGLVEAPLGSSPHTITHTLAVVPHVLKRLHVNLVLLAQFCH